MNKYTKADFHFRGVELYRLIPSDGVSDVIFISGVHCRHISYSEWFYRVEIELAREVLSDMYRPQVRYENQKYTQARNYKICSRIRAEKRKGAGR